jgi:hypothetical protein
MSPSNADIEIKFIGKYQKYVFLAKAHCLVSNTNNKMSGLKYQQQDEYGDYHRALEEGVICI